ncbi:hypothetical protein Tco_1357646, partial [Tanacetum coccineum]
VKRGEWWWWWRLLGWWQHMKGGGGGGPVADMVVKRVKVKVCLEMGFKGEVDIFCDMVGELNADIRLNVMGHQSSYVAIKGTWSPHYADRNKTWSLPTFAKLGSSARPYNSRKISY